MLFHEIPQNFARRRVGQSNIRLFILFDQCANEFHKICQAMCFVVSDFIHEAVKQINHALVLILRANYSDVGTVLQLTPGSYDAAEIFARCFAGNIHLTFHLPRSYSACVNTCLTYTFWRLKWIATINLHEFPMLKT